MDSLACIFEISVGQAFGAWSLHSGILSLGIMMHFPKLLFEYSHTYPANLAGWNDAA